MAFFEKFISETLGLTKFPPYLSTFYWAFLGFLLVHQVIAPVLSARWFPTAYAGKSKAAKNNWSIHVVSQVHVLIIVPYALYSILNEDADRSLDKAFGWDARVGYVHAIASGYFLWDTLDAIVNFIDPGFVAHGVACFFIYTMSYKPFVAYYGTRCLLWETSTFFLNNHWFLDKTGRTGTRAQLINGFFLLTSFFLVRIVYGGYISVNFLITLIEVKKEIPIAYTLVYGTGNVILQSLNWFWFYKMIAALRKRFGDNDQVKLTGADEIPTHINNGPPQPLPISEDRS
ncbi:putative TLC domain-containing protein C17A2.02c [Psilocybe cubensis]|uniref:TLC domain-containing protein C17A2.02c n=2 Tax=Psilocybe cubensis TaxID=181762 RepID=A0ACB8H7D0_PSICU|nr:putative TLC domain-containing protein C17A2.02c [Psilocybe cubensis]KAH9483895.1 putative TLC domain-containing protein C17A2.02c [Psilocybe cubensis]